MNQPRELPLSGFQAMALTARALIALTKPRIAFASVLTGLAGYAAVRGAGGLRESVSLLAGAGLAAGGALAFNQWWERDSDSLMVRTRHRPLVRELITPGLALGWSIVLSVAGVAWLGAAFNMTAAVVAAAIIVIYGLIYTPMKRVTHWATEVGSVSGALPPLLGSAAAGDIWSVPAWILAAVLLFWQMPHSFAIGWIHRADYRAAGMALMPAIDEDGRRTSAWSLAYSIPLAVVLILPWPLGWMGAVFGITASVTAVVLFALAWQFYKVAGDREREARLLFRATLITLLLLLLAMTLDRG